MGRTQQFHRSGLQEDRRYNEFPPYKGGDTMFSGNYIYEFLPHHHLANHWGWVAQHRVIAEALLGRPLARGQDPKVRECVHHKDENKLNNSPENLEVLTFSAHRTYHSRNSKLIRMAQMKKSLRQQLEKGIFEAAKSLGCNHNTLRNNFPDEVKHLLRKTPLNIHSPEVVALLKEYGPSNQHGYREVAKLLGTASTMFVKRAYALHQIPWTKKTRKGELHRTYRGQPIQRG